MFSPLAHTKKDQDMAICIPRLKEFRVNLDADMITIKDAIAVTFSSAKLFDSLFRKTDIDKVRQEIKRSNFLPLSNNVPLKLCRKVCHNTTAIKSLVAKVSQLAEPLFRNSGKMQKVTLSRFQAMVEKLKKYKDLNTLIKSAISEAQSRTLE